MKQHTNDKTQINTHKNTNLTSKHAKTVYVCVRIIVHNCHTQHRAVLIIFPLILQTSNRAQMLSIGEEGDLCNLQAVNEKIK